MNTQHMIRIGFLILATLVTTVVANAQAEIVVSAKPLSELMIEQRQYAPATVTAANQAVIAAQVSAQIKAINAQVGEVVKKGHSLATLDADDYALALEQAKASLAATDAQIKQAQARLDRALKLSGSQYLSADDLLGRETDVAVSTANRITQQVAIKTASHNLTKTRIEAPFDAVIVSRSAQLGSYATPGTPLFELAQLDGRELEAQVATDVIESLQLATSLRYERNGNTWPVKILRVSSVVQSNSGTQIVRLSFLGEPALIGSSGRLSWVGSGTLLSANMLVQRESQLGVFVVTGDRVRFVAVDGAQEGRPANVSLSPETVIVTNGRFKLQDGSKVAVVNP